MSDIRQYSRAELREVIYNAQSNVSQELIDETARLFLERALRVFTLNCPQVRIRMMVDRNRYYDLVHQLCSKIIYKYSSYGILTNPIQFPRLKELAKQGLLWISDHVGEQAQEHAIEIVENTDFDVDRVLQDVTTCWHDPDVPRELYGFLLSPTQGMEMAQSDVERDIRSWMHLYWEAHHGTYDGIHCECENTVEAQSMLDGIIESLSELDKVREEWAKMDEVHTLDDLEEKRYELIDDLRGGQLELRGMLSELADSFRPCFIAPAPFGSLIALQEPWQEQCDLPEDHTGGGGGVTAGDTSEAEVTSRSHVPDCGAGTSRRDAWEESGWGQIERELEGVTPRSIAEECGAHWMYRK